VTKLGAKVKPSFNVFKTSPFGTGIKLSVQNAKLRFELEDLIFMQTFILKK
jgi:hypothetical protein